MRGGGFSNRSSVMEASIDRIGWFWPRRLSTRNSAPRLVPQSSAAMPAAMNVTACTCCRRPIPGHSSASATHASAAAATAGTADQIAPAIASTSIPAITAPATRCARPAGAVSRRNQVPLRCVVAVRA